MIRSVKLWGCGLQRSPEIELIASTQSDPISYKRFVASATIWLSFTPGFSSAAMSWYTPSTILDAMLSSVISSWLLISRAASIICWPSNFDALLLQRKQHGRLTDIEAQRHI